MSAYWFLRAKRNAPDCVVSLIDSCYRGGVIRKNKHAFSSDPGHNIFFIVGCGRSGNTLLKNMLSSRYDVCIPPEIPGLGNTIRQYAKSRSKAWEDLIDDVLEEFEKNADISREFNGDVYNLNAILSIEYDEVKKRLLSLPSQLHGLDSIIFSIYKDYAGRKGFTDTSVIGDKTPWNSFHLGRIIKTFPNAKFVHMVRDPRAVAASYIYNFNGVAKTSASQASHRWVDSLKKIEKYKSLYPSQFFELRYEDLVGDPEASVSKVSNFLMLNKAEEINREEFDIADVERVLPHFAKSFTPPNKESLSKWRELLEKNEVAMVEKKCKAKMRSYGYSNAQ